MWECASSMGAEFCREGVLYLLGGGDWEGFGSDQYLRVLMLESVGGIQDNGAQAIIQHFVANEQEHHRGDSFASNGISANVDDKLRLYMRFICGRLPRELEAGCVDYVLLKYCGGIA